MQAEELSTTEPRRPDGPTAIASPSAGGTLIVMIPCLNEEKTVERVIRGVPKRLPGVREIRIVVLDDGSTDSTAARARDAGAEVIQNGVNLGLGRTFREGVQYALASGADLVVNMDGDGQFDPADITELIAPIVAGRADMATASRFLVDELVPNMPTIKRWGNRWVARIVQLLTGERFHDVSCGYRAFSREALLRMNLFGSFTYTQETFLDLVFKELPIVEVPVKVRGTREFGESRIASSIPRYAVRSLQIMLRAFIGYRPFTLFAVLAGFFGAIGAPLLVFLLYHYLTTGAFSPHVWSGFVGGSFGFLAVLTLVIGLIGEMLVRLRLNQEEILYSLKKERFSESSREPSDVDR